MRGWHWTMLGRDALVRIAAMIAALGPAVSFTRETSGPNGRQPAAHLRRGVAAFSAPTPQRRSVTRPPHTSRRAPRRGAPRRPGVRGLTCNCFTVAFGGSVPGGLEEAVTARAFGRPAEAGPPWPTSGREGRGETGHPADRAPNHHRSPEFLAATSLSRLANLTFNLGDAIHGGAP